LELICSAVLDCWLAEVVRNHVTHPLRRAALPFLFFAAARHNLAANRSPSPKDFVASVALTEEQVCSQTSKRGAHHCVPNDEPLVEFIRAKALGLKCRHTYCFEQCPSLT
jgi:hypothetical protein